MKTLGKTLAIAGLAGFGFALVHIPLPWTLGPIAAISLYSLHCGQRVYWPLKIRNSALLVLGYAMGRPFTAATGYKILEQLPLMMLATVITVLAGVGVGYITYKKTGLSLPTCLLGCVPGGLSQMVVLAAELDNTDQTAVTLMQTIRMLAVVFIVPFLTMHVLHDGDPLLTATAAQIADPSLSVSAIYVLAAIGGAGAAQLLHLPTAYLLGPLLGTAGVVLLTGIAAPVVPDLLLNIAQVLVGTYIGASINLAKLRHYHGLMPCLFGGVAGVLVISLGMGYLVVLLTGSSFVTAFLSTAPGGIAEMGITALLVGADIATMTAYQLVRLLFIMLLFPYIVKMILYFCRKRI